MSDEILDLEDTSSEPGPAKDTQEEEPKEGSKQGGESPQLIFGKYKSIEEAERAFKEAESKMHKASEEAAAFRELASKSFQGHQAPPVESAPARNLKEMNEEFLASLEQNPLNTLTSLVKSVYKNARETERKAESATIRRFNEYSRDPKWADVADDVRQRLPYMETPDVDRAFMEAKIARLERIAQAGGQSTFNRDTPPHSESPNTVGARDDVVRVEIPSDARRVADAFGWDEETYKQKVRQTARSKMDGQLGRVPVSIEEFRKRRSK